ncbi:MAG TPA: hypothetical protein VGM37_05490 [Armatimonadota bacterium]|jgi:hypothetical protein
MAAAKWVLDRWNTCVTDALAGARSSAGIRGPVLARAPLDAGLAALRVGASNPAPVFRPRVTSDPDVNRYGVGFLVRVSADIGARIPAPVLDLSGLSAKDAPWIGVWVDEAVRNGVAGITIVPPPFTAGAKASEKALAPMRGANVFLPPPGEAAILVSLATGVLEPGAWVQTFRTYARMRRSGLWPPLISDEQIEAGVPLARYAILAAPAAKWSSPAVLTALAGFRARGGVLVIEDGEAFSRRLDGWETSAAARALLGAPVESGSTEWADVASKAGIPKRPWLESVSARNVRAITGRAERFGTPGR